MDDQTVVEPDARASDIAAQETDAWWGSYSGWTMLPSLLVCVVLTGAIVWWAGNYVERRHLQWTVWALAGAVWLVQTTRWCVRVFGHNYRLTSRRLFIEKGHYRQRRHIVELRDIVDVAVVRHVWGRWTGVGRLVIQTRNAGAVMMPGVSHPEQVAERVRALCDQLRQGVRP